MTKGFMTKYIGALVAAACCLSVVVQAAPPRPMDGTEAMTRVGVYGYAIDRKATGRKWVEIRLNVINGCPSLAGVPKQVTKILRAMKPAVRRFPELCMYVEFRALLEDYTWGEKFCAKMGDRSVDQVGQSIQVAAKSYLDAHKDAHATYFFVESRQVTPLDE